MSDAPLVCRCLLSRVQLVFSAQPQRSLRLCGKPDFQITTAETQRTLRLRRDRFQSDPLPMCSECALTNRRLRTTHTSNYRLVGHSTQIAPGVKAHYYSSVEYFEL